MQDKYTREDMQGIKQRANEQYGDGDSATWIRAWIALADAADRIDAMIARTEVKE